MQDLIVISNLTHNDLKSVLESQFVKLVNSLTGFSTVEKEEIVNTLCVKSCLNAFKKPLHILQMLNRKAIIDNTSISYDDLCATVSMFSQTEFDAFVEYLNKHNSK